MSAIKPRPTPLLGHRGRVPTLVVRHPHYPDYNTLVKLPALDHGDTVDYDVALIICGIISDNSWRTGWFARSADGSNVCERGAPLVAADGDVFYFVGHRTYKYPVYVSWDHWRVPKADADLPSAFSTLPIEPPPRCHSVTAAIWRTLRAATSRAVCRALLTSVSKRTWSRRARGSGGTNMGGSSDLEIQSALNGMLLRADLHRSFDAGTWVPMVKEGGRLVVYVVRTADVSNQFAALWHNVEMQKLVGIDRRCLFARVAWAVLSLHHEFLSIRRLASDNLLVRVKGDELKEMAPEMFKQFSRSRSRNPSPTKRPRLQALEEEAGVIIAAELGWGDEAGDEAGNNLEDKEQQLYGADDDSGPYQRGRRRLRSPTQLPPPQWDVGIDPLPELDHLYMPITPSRAKKRIKRATTVQQAMFSHPLIP